MSTISSSTLFHFTDTAEHLLSILENEFRPHLSLEDFSLLTSKQAKDRDFRMAIPMVSFCDIPLSQATNHMDTYGHYAVGLTKAWGMQRGLTPVLYTHDGSLSLKALVELGRLAKSQRKFSDSVADAIMANLSRVLLLSKPYEGPYSRRGQPPKHVRFYDEREWRFIPPSLDDVPVLSPSTYDDVATRDAANAKVAQYVLSFTPSDIRYVIVPSEAELLPTIRELERIKGPKYSLDDVKVLTSRVMSAEQIQADF